MGLKNGKCEECIKENKKSTVHEPLYGATTLMCPAPAYYDEDGVYHESYNPNNTMYEWSCSNGHKWTEII